MIGESQIDIQTGRGYKMNTSEQEDSTNNVRKKGSTAIDSVSKNGSDKKIDWSIV